MSHFTVLVIGNNVDDQLAPFHEFECTGKNDQYVKDVDVTEEYRQSYMKETTKYLVSPTGEKVDYYDNRFYRKPNAEEKKKDPFARDVRDVPAGWTELSVPTHTVQNFAEYAKDYGGHEVIGPLLTPDLEGKHQFGYIRLNEDGEVDKIIRRTNPDKKWDWYVIGGRWTGFLKLKAGAIGNTGSPGLMTEAAPSGYADQTTKGSVDWQGMRDAAGTKAAARWDEVRKASPDLWESWDDVRDKRFPGDIEKARDYYHKQPGREALRDHKDLVWTEDDVLVSRDQYIQTARDKACATYAVLADGKWMGRGEMGWFGFSDDKEDEAVWYKKVAEMIDSLPDDTMLTVVDCHI